MLIDLRKLEDGTIEFDFEIGPDEVDLSARFSKLTEPVKFVGRVRKDGWITKVSAEATARLERKCDRCLALKPAEESVAVDSAYVKYSSLGEERENELEILGLEYSVIESDELNLKDVFSENLLIAMPDGFSCAADCLGICPECGAKLEDSDCDCEKKSVDPRWAALSEIKKELD
ncbi:MAG: DUF177 domain-containing protein [Pyrinomonadaceae bacterium]|nr:DUF177 domain-containing protein [Pyrinomonadaceae bacterium]